MTKVNWIKNDEYYEVLINQNKSLLKHYIPLNNSGREVWVHSSRSNYMPDEYSRVLDDSPEKDWGAIYPMLTSKEQKDGWGLVRVREDKLPEVYLLIEPVE
jgi:hypothetical protein